MSVEARPTSDLLGAAEHVLASWTAAAESSTTGPDPGLVVLAALVPDSATARAATKAWVRVGARPGQGLGLHGGAAGLVAGLRLVAGRRPGLAPAAHRASASLAAAPTPWRTAGVGFTDYDVVSGPAGVVLAQLTGSPPVQPHHLAPAVTHLLDVAETGGFRIGGHSGHPLAAWAQGGVVTGLAHGVAGPLTALSLAAPLLPADARLPETVHRCATWLAGHRFTDRLGVVSWPHLAPVTEKDVQVARQGWCYGNPGVAWALWSAGNALGDATLCGLACDALRTLCERYDPGHHLDHNPLGVCHGAAGVLLVADAFARHAGLAPAAELRDELVRFVLDRLDEVERLDAGLLTGAPGVLAALLTATGGDRGWLPCLALR